MGCREHGFTLPLSRTDNLSSDPATVNRVNVDGRNNLRLQAAHFGIPETLRYCRCVPYHLPFEIDQLAAWPVRLERVRWFRDRNTMLAMPLRRMGCLLFAAGMIYSPSSFTQSYPVKPIRLVLPVSPGGGSDVIVRLVTQKLNAAIGQQFVIHAMKFGLTDRTRSPKASHRHNLTRLQTGSDPICSTLQSARYWPTRMQSPTKSKLAKNFLLMCAHCLTTSNWLN